MSPTFDSRTTGVVQVGQRSENADNCEFTTDWAIAPSSCSGRERPAAGPMKGAVYPAPSLNHDELLSLARATVGAARDHDPDRVEADARRLLVALSDHALAEGPEFLHHLSTGDARLLRHAQQKIEDLLFQLAATAAQKTGRRDYESLADEVVARLALQVADERRHLLAVGD